MLDVELVNIHDGNTYIFTKYKDSKKNDNVSYSRFKNGKLYSSGSMSLEEFTRLMAFKTFVVADGK